MRPQNIGRKIVHIALFYLLLEATFIFLNNKLESVHTT